MQTDEKIFSALERIQAATKSVLVRAGYSYGLSSLQVQILDYIQRHTSASVSQLADVLRVSKPTISDAVASLVAKKLVTRLQNTEDGRGFRLLLSESGQEAAGAISGYTAPFVDAVHRLSDSQKEALWDALLHLLRTLDLQGLIPRQRMCLSCRHFQRQHGEASFYCGLMQLPLAVRDLRLECEDHLQLA